MSFSKKNKFQNKVIDYDKIIFSFSLLIICLYKLFLLHNYFKLLHIETTYFFIKKTHIL